MTTVSCTTTNTRVKRSSSKNVSKESSKSKSQSSTPSKERISSSHSNTSSQVEPSKEGGAEVARESTRTKRNSKRNSSGDNKVATDSKTPDAKTSEKKDRKGKKSSKVFAHPVLLQGDVPKHEKAQKRSSVKKENKEQNYKSWMGLLDGLEEELKTVAPQKKEASLIGAKEKDTLSAPTVDKLAQRTSSPRSIPKRLSVKDLNSHIQTPINQLTESTATLQSKVEIIGLEDDLELDMMLKDLCEGTF